MERSRGVPVQDGQEILRIYDRLALSFPYDKTHKLPKLRIKPRTTYGQELFIEYWANEEVTKNGRIVLQRKRKRLTGLLNQIPPNELFLFSINVIVFLYSKIKAGYVFRYKPMGKNLSYDSLMRTPFQQLMMLPTLYTLIEHRHKTKAMSNDQYSNMKAHLNVFTRYAHNIDRKMPVKLEEINFRHKFIDFDHSDAVKFKDYLQTSINPRSGKPDCDTTVDNNFSDMKNLINKIMERKKDIPSSYKNPFKGHKIKRSAPEVHVVYEPKELIVLRDGIIETGNEQLLLLVMLMYYCGCRVVEAKRMQLGNINLDKKMIHLSPKQTKNKQHRDIPINGELHKIFLELNLDQYPKDYFLFSVSRTPGKKQVSRNYFQKQFKNVRDKAGLSKNHTIYSLRHTFAMNYMMGVKDDKDSSNKIYALMEYLGHASFEETKGYLRKLGYKLSQAETFKGFPKFGESPQQQ